MFQLDNTIVSEDILDTNFVCNLNACKGSCCVHGSAGAPLEKEEVTILKTIFPKIKPILSQKSLKAIKDQGVYVKNKLGELETPLINNAECAYVIFKNNIAFCAIEEAYNQGKISFKKPISCHLYPVRIKKYTTFYALNYHKWEICNAACTLGNKLKTPIYSFVKDALIRKFGAKWYSALKQVAIEKEASKS